MEKIQKKVRELLSEKKIDLAIGYQKSPKQFAKVIFANAPEQADKFIFDESCRQNLALYIHKPEVKAFGKIGIIANVPAIKTLLELAAENQIKDGQILALTVGKDGEVIEFTNFASMEDYVAKNPVQIPPPAQKKLDYINSMSIPERWKFWQEELSACVKCYACRSACPLCYCTQCITECNQPQWVSVQNTALGNFEWHVNRAMHLAGRCIECGECSRACPVGIPLTLLTVKLNDDIETAFNQRPGMKATNDYAFSTYKFEDKENLMR